MPSHQAMSLDGPGPEERVRVLVPRVTTVDAVVARVVPGAAELALIGPSAVPLRFLHRRSATVVTLAGDRRVDGTLLAVPGSHGHVREDLLHFLQAVVPLAPRRPAAQRRDHTRVAFVRPVIMVPDVAGAEALQGFTRNVSAGGVLVAGADALDEGAQLRLRLELDADDLLEVLARVVRADRDWGLRGLRMEGLTDRERERLVRFVFLRQRAALERLQAGVG